jgi:uncharacterized protein (DUF1800 family)
MESWQPYVPDEMAPWDMRRVVHLHRRAGFAATWDELERDLADGPEASIRRVLEGKTRSAGVPLDFESTATLLADAAQASNDAARLKACWVFRMLLGPDPLGERLTLLWHDHFATSNLKVKNLAAMRQQNDLFRRHGRGPFRVLLDAVVRDPALLIWLDASSNRKDHPNENLARELLELFTLGIGPYSETDVKEAARALTGWTVEDDLFREIARRRDDGIKTIIGHTGKLTASDLLRILTEHPATSKRLARRLCDWLMGEKAVSETAVAALAEGLRAHDLDIGWAVATVLRSRAFWDPANLRSRVLGPVEMVVGSLRALELFDPPPSTLMVGEWIAKLGQDLFYPPNVGGWPGGRAWLSSRGLIGRANYAAAVVGGRGIGRPEAFDALGLARGRGIPTRREPVLRFFVDLVLGGEPEPGWLDRIAGSLGTKSAWGPEAARHAVAIILASPEGQVA